MIESRVKCGEGYIGECKLCNKQIEGQRNFWYVINGNDYYHLLCAQSIELQERDIEMKRVGSPINPATLQQVPQVQAPPVQAPAMPASPYAVPPQAPYAPPVPQVPTMEAQIRQAIDTPPPPVPMPTPAPIPPPQPQPVLQQVNQDIPSIAQAYTAGVQNTPPQSPKSILHALDCGTEPVKVFKTIPGGEDIEVEIVKVELKTVNDKPALGLQERCTWPAVYAGALVWDTVYLTAEASWKYKSLCAACVDESGNRLLSADNRFFVGNSEQDFLGNIVACKTDEPNPGTDGRVFNRVKGGYNIATRTEVEEPSGNGAQATAYNPAGVPPVPTF